MCRGGDGDVGVGMCFSRLRVLQCNFECRVIVCKRVSVCTGICLFVGVCVCVCRCVCV